MNPGVFAAGGGGDGGGAGGKGGKNGNGKQGANGDGNGEDGTGDSNSACGNGSRCPQRHAGGSPAAGDPVDIQTGRVYTLPVCDLYLPGWFPLIVSRVYSSAAWKRNVGFGWGWSHAFAWEIEVGRRNVKIWRGDNATQTFPFLEPGAEFVGPNGWLLRRNGVGFELDTGDGRWREFALRLGDRCLMTELRDRNRNRIQLEYADDQLLGLVDTVGRRVEFKRDGQGQIVELSVRGADGNRTATFTRYRYDREGDLVEVEDADGNRSRFAYQAHRVVRATNPLGLTTFYRLDRAGRCIETWAEYEGAEDPALDESAPKLLADNVTPARGIYHTKLDFSDPDYTEVIDSTRVDRIFRDGAGGAGTQVCGSGVFTREYDEHGFVVEFRDANDAVTSWKRDGRGRILEYIDPLGRTFQLERDANGKVTRGVDPAGNEETAWYDPRGNLISNQDVLGEVISYRYGDHGELLEVLLPNGGRTALSYDDAGNRISVTEPDGAHKTLTYDWLGRIASETDEAGCTNRYEYTPFGSLARVHHAQGGTTDYTWRYGLLGSRLSPDGTLITYHYGGLYKLYEARIPGGHKLGFRFDREGKLTAAIDQAGRVHRMLYDRDGHLMSEHTVDGRKLTFRSDANGRLAGYSDAEGNLTEMTYDASGQLVLRLLSDGDSQCFEYDARGYVARVTNAESSIGFERDVAGRIVKETQIFDGVERSVESAYGGLNAPSLRSVAWADHGSAAALLRFESDVCGRLEKAQLEEDLRVEFSNYLYGRERAVRLPGGPSLESEYERATALLTERRIRRDDGAPKVGYAEPEWVGERPDACVLRKAFRYSIGGRLLSRWDQQRGEVEYAYDDAQRLVHADSSEGREVYAYDAAGDLIQGTLGAYDYLSGRVIQAGGTRYVYDTDGRLVEQEGERGLWRYTWSAGGLLREVETPESTRVSFGYDALGRRLSKQVLKRDPVGHWVPVSRVHYVWSEDWMVEEAHYREDRLVEQVAYCYKPGTHEAYAQCRVRHTDAGPEKRWSFFVNDHQGTPEHLVSAEGEVLGAARSTAYGVTEWDGTEATNLRFPGHYFDNETGLHYNRHRYYDPQLGRYISPDPISLLGGLNPYAYAVGSPVNFFDRYGLTVTTLLGAEDQNTNKRGQLRSQQDRQYNVRRTSGGPGEPHPLVGQCLSDTNRVAGTTRSPGDCAEPQAVSNYLQDWERNNRARLRREGHDIPSEGPFLHEHPDLAREALGQVNSMQPHTNVDRVDQNGNPLPAGSPVACCSNCEVLVDNLVERGLNREAVNPVNGPKIREG